MITAKQFKAAYDKFGSVKKVAAGLGITYYQARKGYLAAVEAGIMVRQPVGRKSMEQIQEQVKPPVMEGRLRALRTRSLPLPKDGKIARHLFTCAQNNTDLHEDFWTNLLALAEHYEADIHVSRFAYIKSGLGARGDKAEAFAHAMNQGGAKGADKEEFDDYLHFDERLDPYLSDERVEVAPGLVWCGEMNILPTAVRPLSGMESYTGRKSAVFPHTKIAMESVASMKEDATKFNYTTGAVTMRNYIHRKAGFKADFHHCYGALLVEVDSNGTWFCRQLNGDSEGTIYDLDVRVADGKVTTGNRVMSITWGDSHGVRRDRVVEALAKLMLRKLRPFHQIFEDLLDFWSQNHHERKDPFKRFEKFIKNRADVHDEVWETFEYLAGMVGAAPTDCNTVVADSNHDRALERWLREADWRHDPQNMIFYMESALAKLRALRDGRDFHMLAHWWDEWLDYDPALGLRADLDGFVQFLDEDESYIICPDAGGGIECGIHGHLGPNGRRGSIEAFARMGRKANIGHSHIAGIRDGIYQAGTSSLLDLGYNSGPSSWSRSMVVTYQNGKRAIVTMFNNKWRA